MYDFFLLNFEWFIGGWYLIAFIIATIIASYTVYKKNEPVNETLGIFYVFALLSPLIIPISGIVLLFSPLLIPWFITRKIVLKKRIRQEHIDNIKR